MYNRSEAKRREAREKIKENDSKLREENFRIEEDIIQWNRVAYSCMTCNDKSEAKLSRSLNNILDIIVTPPDTTTLALVNSGLSLTFSSSPTHDDRLLLVSAAGAVRQRMMHKTKL